MCKLQNALACILVNSVLIDQNGYSVTVQFSFSQKRKGSYACMILLVHIIFPPNKTRKKVGWIFFSCQEFIGDQEVSEIVILP